MLTSAKNAKITAAARLKKRAFREEDRRFLVEGAQGVAEALEESRLEILFTADDQHPSAVRARQSGLPCHLVSEDVIGKITSTVTPQPIVGVAPFVDVGLDDLPMFHPAFKTIAFCHSGSRAGETCTLDTTDPVNGCPGGSCPTCCYSETALAPRDFAVIAERIDNYREHCTVLQKMRTRAAMKTLFAELENYAGSELDADYD